MPSSIQTTVLIADNDFIYRNYLEKIIRSIQAVSSVLKAETAEQALDLLSENPACSIAVIACRTEKINAAALAREIKIKYPNINIIALSYAADYFTVIEMIESGARSFIVKGSTRSDYCEAVTSAINNKAWFSPAVAQYIVHNIHNDNQYSTLKKSASEDKFKVLRLVCMDFTSQEIYEKTGIKKRTVEGHRSDLIKEFNVRSPIGLGIEVIRRGIINIDEINTVKKELLEKEKKKKKK
jgi:DNA-binding NarL/FixJ family response regulator